ncbi:glycosyltransferase 87 family protein [Streptomyces varsoviensis]|uniref:glycosyltransferase 87 family protein n=1 Tax=Streptomyces varsoviensis TaxID=67373 RepID=UPI0033DF6711
MAEHPGWCLGISIGLHALAVTISSAAPADLRVYFDASPRVLSGGLYDYRLHIGPPIPVLPFTYPPFAALAFLPLSRLPWPAAVWLWQAVSVAALFAISLCALRLLGPGASGASGASGTSAASAASSAASTPDAPRAPDPLDAPGASGTLGTPDAPSTPDASGRAAPRGTSRSASSAPALSRALSRAPSPTLSRAMLWTAVGLWLEPVRHTLDQGQVNLLLGAVVLGALAALRTAAGRGAAVGLAAAVKLTPAFGGLYFLATRQWRAAVWAVAAAVAATAAAWRIAPRESAEYWTTLVSDTRRIGPLWSVRNQSLRGALSRFLGHDAAAGSLVWWPVLALVTALAAYALLRAARRRDFLGILITAELYGLLLSPISWSHHWIWCLPAMIWLVHGAGRGRPFSRVVLAAWLLASATRLVPLLIRWEDGLHARPYPGAMAWPGAAYAVCALLSLVAVSTSPAPVADPGHDRPARPPETAYGTAT